MGSGLYLFRIRGIPIRLHASWFLIFALLTWSLASSFSAPQGDGFSSGMAWLAGLFTSLLFFASVLAHELGHAFVALRERVPVRSISLFFFGGVAQIGHDPKSAGAEFRIAIAGPLVSLILATVFVGLVNLGPGGSLINEPVSYLARINLILAAFNLIPGYPLDGGRVLKAIVWKITGSSHQATRIASVTGQIAALGFIAYGVFLVFTGSFASGIWLGFIGWFLHDAAGNTLVQSRMQERFGDIEVEQVMSRSYPTVPEELTLDALAMLALRNPEQPAFVVEDRGVPAGIITSREMQAIPRHAWRWVTAGEIMQPWERFTPLRPEMSLIAALQQMEEADQTIAPVVVGDQIRGLLSRDSVLRYLRLRDNLGV